MVFQQATFLTAIFVAQNLPSATLSRAFLALGTDMQFDCACFVFFGQACFVVLVQALRFLFATPLPLGRWGNCMFNVKVLQAQRPFISFHVFSDRRCTFFLCAGGLPSVLVQALRCFSQRHCRLAGWAAACFRQKFAGAAWFSLFAVFSVEKCVASGFC